MARLFISQERLDDWTSGNKAILEGDTLTLSDLGRSFAVQPAVRFLSVAGAEADPMAWLEKVKTCAELGEQGAEVYMNSVLYEDTAYEVQPGFIGTAIPK